MKLTSEFSNPDKKPLNELYINTKGGKYKALNEIFVEQKSFAKYLPLLLKNGKLDDEFQVDLWLQQVTQFNEDLIWILKLPYHKFWNQMIYDKELQNNLVYFFQESTPFYLPIISITSNRNIVNLFVDVGTNAVKIICRLITNKESETEWMSRETIGELLYTNYLVSVPLLFDIVALYGTRNHSLLKKIFDTVFKLQPNYLGDLKVGIKFIQKTFDTMQQQLEETQNETSELSSKYEDLALFLISSATTISLILDLVPVETKIVCTRELKLEQSIASFYDNFIPNLYKSACLVDPEFWFLNLVNFARIELINSFRCLLNRNIEIVLNGHQKTAESSADEFLSVLTECAGHRIFVADYKRSYPVECDLDILEQSCKKLDDIKLNFVKEAFMDDGGDGAREPLKNGHSSYGKNELMIIIDEEIEGACALSPTAGPSTTEKVPENIEDLIVQETNKILELFPYYGTGFIRRILARYDNSAEKAITVILEDNLDPDLAQYDQSEPYIPPEIPDKVYAATGVERSNAYDNDEFDVMRRDTFGGVVKKHGKVVSERVPKNLNELLNDKSHVQSMKTFYQKYSLINDNEDVEYDDEYDDSYDALVESEPKVRLQANMKNVLVDEVESEESESEEEAPTPSVAEDPKKKLEFCENPEAIRARREQQYQSKMAKKHPQRNNGGANNNGNSWRNTKSNDVVGNAKGQGQSDDILRNRQNKGVHKSTRANHNRKQGSQYKQSKGMF